MATKDFQTNQIKVSKIISQESEKILIYNADAASGDEGVNSLPDKAGGLGDDVSVYIHGLAGFKDDDALGGTGITLFAGDVVVSGSLYDGTGALITGGGGSMTSFTLSDNETIPGIQTIEDGNTLTVAGGAGLTSTVSATDNLIITLDDTSVTPSTYGDATNVPQLTVDQQGRITGVTDVAISASGGSSVGASGVVQVSDGSSGFEAATILEYDTLNDKLLIGADVSGATANAKLDVWSKHGNNLPCLKLTQKISSTEHSDPALIIESNTTTNTSSVEIKSNTTQNQIKIINDFNAGNNEANLILQDENFIILNGQLNAITEIAAMSGTGGSPLGYSIIKGQGNSSNKPFVSILADVSLPPISIIDSTDVNFYVEGTPGSLGSTTVKGTSQFGGDVKVDGFVSREGIAHLTKDAHQRIIPIASYDDGTWNPAPGVLLNGPAGDVIFDGTPLILDPNFYTFTPSSSSDFIKIKRDGKYKVSYGALTIQTYHTWAGSAYAHPSWTSAYNAIAERTSIQSILTMKRGITTTDIDNSMSSCYMRRDWISRWCFTSSTIIDVITDDEIRLRLRPIACTPNDTVEFEVRADQCWLTIEKIQ